MAGLSNQEHNIRYLQGRNARTIDALNAFMAYLRERLACAPWHYGPNRPMNCYLTALLPHAASVGFAAGVPEVICVAKMTATTFWEFIGERLDIPKEALPEGDDYGSIEVGDARETGSANGVVMGTKMRLFFLRVPHDLPLPLKPDEMDVGMLPNMQLWARLKDTHAIVKTLDSCRQSEIDGETLKGDPPVLGEETGLAGPEWLQRVFAMRGRRTEGEKAKTSAKGEFTAEEPAGEQRTGPADVNQEFQKLSIKTDDQTTASEKTKTDDDEGGDDDDDATSPVSSIDSDGTSSMSLTDYISCELRLVAWAHCNGLLSEQFGYLTHECLIALLDQAYERCSSGKMRAAFGGADSDETWSEVKNRNLIELCCQPTLLGGGMSEGVLNIHSTTGRKLTFGMTAEAIRAFKRAVVDIMDSASIHTVRDGYIVFGAQFDAYFILSTTYWNPRKLNDFVQDITDAALKLQLEIGRLTKYAVRIWPTLFHEPETQHLRIVMGLYHQKEERAKVASLPNVGTGRRLKELYADVILDNVQYERSCSHMSVAVVEPDAIRFPLRAATEDSVCKTSQGSEQSEAAAEPRPGPSRTPASQPPKPTTTPATYIKSYAGIPDKSKKLRPAQAALDRLTWDDKHMSTHYEIGYEDRFEGIMWKDLEQWQNLTEEEDFIPAHRIRTMRRKGDKGIVWDREERVDLL